LHLEFPERHCSNPVLRLLNSTSAVSLSSQPEMDAIATHLNNIPFFLSSKFNTQHRRLNASQRKLGTHHTFNRREVGFPRHGLNRSNLREKFRTSRKKPTQDANSNSFDHTGKKFTKFSRKTNAQSKTRGATTKTSRVTDATILKQTRTRSQPNARRPRRSANRRHPSGRSLRVRVRSSR